MRASAWERAGSAEAFRLTTPLRGVRHLLPRTGEPGGVAGWGTAGTSAMTLVGRELPLSLRLCAVPAKRRLSQASCAEAIEGAPEVYADELAERIYRAMTAAAKA
jgi:hypothetical protein